MNIKGSEKRFAVRTLSPSFLNKAISENPKAIGG